MKTTKELVRGIQFNGDQVVAVPNELQLIGQGRSAAVFRRVGSMRAVKVFYSGQQDLAEKEGKIYEQLSKHVYYPELFEVGDGYLVIEYLEGMTLYDCLVSGVPITPRMVTMVDEALNRSEEHTSELQSRGHLVCRILLERKTKKVYND